jgi:23S rRNA (cytosine1962-C5)-methyltransferase
MNETILSLCPGPWADYELIDTGGFEKLERFGKYILSRPEPQAIWDKSLQETEWRKLNLFAYTGAASVACRAAGADVTHLDSVKQVVTWSKHNMESSGLDGIRWMVDDAMKFIKREARRGNVYQGIILDPPAYGRGPEGEKWILEEQINEMLKTCSEILDKNNHFLLLNMYSLSFSSLIAANLIRSNFGAVKNPEQGELYLEEKQGKKLPLGIFFRFSSF